MQEKNENQKNLLEKIKEFLLKSFNYLKNLALKPFNKIKEEKKRKMEEERRRIEEAKQRRLEEEERQRKLEEERIRAEKEEKERRHEARLMEIRKAAKEKGYDFLYEELNEKIENFNRNHSTWSDDEFSEEIYQPREDFKIAFYGDEDFWGGCFETAFENDGEYRARGVIEKMINIAGFAPEKNLFIMIIINFIKNRGSEKQGQNRTILSNNFVLIYNMLWSLTTGSDNFEQVLSFKKIIHQNEQSILEISVEEWGLSRRNFVLKMKDRFYNHLSNSNVRKFFVEAGLRPSDMSDFDEEF